MEHRDHVRRGALSLRNVTKLYGNVHAVDHISLDVRPGEFITLLGPSGSGKTTTLRIVIGFIEPDSGNVILDGRDMGGVPPHDRDMGMVFQNYALFPHMTAGENIAFPLEMRGLSRREVRSRVEAALELVHLGGLWSRFPRQLSGGQQQRVALARALVFGPCLLLMDEPLGALDKKLRESLQLEIKRISRQVGTTVVYVTHDQEEALVMSDRIAVYNQGQIEQVGTPQELYERPESLFVANFIGESNVFRGALELGFGGGVLIQAKRRILVSHDASKQFALSTGSQAVVVVRPERLRVVPKAIDSSAHLHGVGNVATVFEGRVREVIYVGATNKYMIDLDDGTTAVARVQAGQQIGDVAVGTVVQLSWEIAHGVLVEDSGPSTSSESEVASTAIKHNESAASPINHTPDCAPPPGGGSDRGDGMNTDTYEAISREARSR